MKRIIDLFLVLVLGILLILPIMIILILVKLTSEGPMIYWSNRVGKNNLNFNMPKFRTMKIDTPVVATHLLIKPERYFTPIGSYLRRSSLDELPQLWSILIGDMSFVGPRPALYSQTDLISLRIRYDIDKLTPGLTGWAQINGRDELTIEEKTQYDLEYLDKISMLFDAKILFITLIKVCSRSGVLH